MHKPFAFSKALSGSDFLLRRRFKGVHALGGGGCFVEEAHFFELEGLLSACKGDFVLFDLAVFLCVAAFFLSFSALLRFKANFLFSSFVSAFY